MFLIKGGTIVNADRSLKADMRLHGDQIVEIGYDLEADSEEVVDATDKFVLPGAIDPHVHFRDMNLSYKEDFNTATLAAIAGGVTTAFDMPNSDPPTVDMKSLQQKKEAAKKANCNLKFYVGATEDNLENLGELLEAPDVIGIKAYLGSSTGNLLFDDKTQWDKLLSMYPDTVVAVHAECECGINDNTKKFHDVHDPQIHSVIRGNEVAEAATRKIVEIGFKYNAHLHIAHMSTREELFVVREYREKGYTNLTCEVCPHHLIFNLDDYETYGTFIRINPPIRSREDRNSLWEDGIALGLVDMIATDHSPHTLEEKKQDYWKAPSGMPCVQECSSLILNQVSKGELTLEKFVELRSTNVAKVFGLKKRGILKEGNIADIMIVDMNRTETITQDWLRSKCGWSNYEGRKVTGWVEKTFVSGDLVYTN